MAEVIVARCDKCESILRSFSRTEVFVGTFLKTCLALGWAWLDTDADVKRIEDGARCITLTGLCPDCTKDMEEALQKYS